MGCRAADRDGAALGWGLRDEPGSDGVGGPEPGGGKGRNSSRLGGGSPFVLLSLGNAVKGVLPCILKTYPTLSLSKKLK